MNIWSPRKSKNDYKTTETDCFLFRQAVPQFIIFVENLKQTDRDYCWRIPIVVLGIIDKQTMHMFG